MAGNAAGRFITPLQTLLQKIPHIDDDSLRTRFAKGMANLFVTNDDKALTKSTVSRQNLAREHLEVIRTKFGDSVYYLCIFGSSITALGNRPTDSGFDEALEAWPERHNLPAGFPDRARDIIDKYLAEETIATHSAPGSEGREKRHRSTSSRDDPSSSSPAKRIRRGGHLDARLYLASAESTAPSCPQPVRIDAAEQACSNNIESGHSLASRNNTTSHDDENPGRDSIYQSDAIEQHRFDLREETQSRSHQSNIISRQDGDRDGDRDGDGEIPNGPDGPTVRNGASDDQITTAGLVDASGSHQDTELVADLPLRNERQNATPQEDSVLLSQDHQLSRPHDLVDFNMYKLEKEDIYEVLAFYKGPINLIIPLLPNALPQITIECSFKTAVHYLQQREEIMSSHR